MLAVCEDVSMGYLLVWGVRLGVGCLGVGGGMD
jgi:hypothetical protein